MSYVALKETEHELGTERAQNADLQARVSQLESDAQSAESQIVSLAATEKELTDKSRDQVSALRHSCRSIRLTPGVTGTRDPALEREGA